MMTYIRNKILKRAYIAILSGLILVFCVSCEKAEQPEHHTLRVAFSQSGTDNQWMITEDNDLREKIADRGYELLYRNAQNSFQQQKEDLEELINEHPDYLIVAPREYYGMDELIRKAVEEGIYVFVIGRDLHGIGTLEGVTVIKSRLYLQGFICGEYIADLFQGRNCNILQITGPDLASSTLEQTEGFFASVSKHPNMHVLESGGTDYIRGRSRIVIDKFLKKRGAENIDAIFAQNDDIAMDAIAAVEAAGLVAGEDIRIFSHDGSMEALRAIVAGKLTMTVECTPYYGSMVCNTIHRLEHDRPVPKRLWMSDCQVYDSSNALRAIQEFKTY